MLRNGGTTSAAQPACAACKHQRKKCHVACVLAPYFPAERSREFQAVHKVFGVSNVTKMIKSLAIHEDRRKAVDSLIWEACCRQRDPILGPYAEYRKVFDELKLYKCQENNNNTNNNNNHIMISQLPCHQRTHKSLVGWNSVSTNGVIIDSNNNGINSNSNNNIVNNNSSLSCYLNENNGSVGVDQIPFSNYASSNNYVHNQDKIIRQDKNNGDIIVPGVLQSQNSVINGFNHQQYYLSGQLICQVNSSKTIESTIWDGGS